MNKKKSILSELSFEHDLIKIATRFFLRGNLMRAYFKDNLEKQTNKKDSENKQEDRKN